VVILWFFALILRKEDLSFTTVNRKVMKATLIGSLFLAAALTANSVYDNPKYDFSQEMSTWIGPVLLRYAITFVVWFLGLSLLNRFGAWAIKKGGVGE
jgi:hypothetical protein